MPPIFMTASAEARAAFGDDTIYMEKYVENARHIEVQLLGDRFGNVIHLGERDCSLQRRYQKVIEEAPASCIDEELRGKICNAAVTLGRAIGYQNAGTVEFIFDQDTRQFYFLEMNTRIQVEHPVTEMITGVDLVAQQFLIARGGPLSIGQADIHRTGHAIECRINAESPQHGFRPCPGRITHWRPAEGAGIRVDSHCFTGYFVPPYYDSLLAKLIVHGGNRTDAVARTKQALTGFLIEGIDTGIPFLRAVLDDPDYLNGEVNIHWLEGKLEEYSASLSKQQTS
jgi:acetyl-CoA carboxylase biotin carboxylase subunit